MIKELENINRVIFPEYEVKRKQKNIIIKIMKSLREEVDRKATEAKKNQKKDSDNDERSGDDFNMSYMELAR